jgi:hypothetical protein
MEDLIYTEEYFQKLKKKQDKRPHRCKECGVPDGARPLDKKGNYLKFPAIVRFALVDPTQPANNADNVALYCTRCRKPTKVWETPRRIKPSQLEQLF